MAGDDQNQLTRRLFARADASAIHRRGTPDGGEVYSGPVVRQALRAVGARAMTMDNAIFVDEDFDLSNPEDQALYAHERHHQLESGGTDEHSHNDHEEMAAQAIERMVLHRSASGEDFASIMRDVEQHGDDAPSVVGAGGGGGTGATESVVVTDDEAQAALASVLASGIGYDQLVRMLGDALIEGMIEGAEDGRQRSSASSTI